MPGFIVLLGPAVARVEFGQRQQSAIASRMRSGLPRSAEPRQVRPSPAHGVIEPGERRIGNEGWLLLMQSPVLALVSR